MQASRTIICRLVTRTRRASAHPNTGWQLRSETWKVWPQEPSCKTFHARNGLSYSQPLSKLRNVTPGSVWVIRPISTRPWTDLISSIHHKAYTKALLDDGFVCRPPLNMCWVAPQTCTTYRVCKPSQTSEESYRQARNLQSPQQRAPASTLTCTFAATAELRFTTFFGLYHARLKNSFAFYGIKSWVKRRD